MCKDDRQSKNNKLITNAFFEEWSFVLDKYATTFSNIIIMEDVNFHLNKSVIGIPDVSMIFWKHHVKEPTHHCEHTLDVVITRSDTSISSDIHVFDPRLGDGYGIVSSDHYTVMCTASLMKSYSVQKTVSYRKFRSINQQKFRTDIPKSYKITHIAMDGSAESLIRQYNTCWRNSQLTVHKEAD